MTERGRSRAQVVLLSVAALALVLGATLISKRPSEKVAPRPEVAAPAIEAVPPAEAPAPAAVVAPPPETVTQPAAYDPHRHAHPITEEHLRMYREDDLLDGAWHALRKRDFVEARNLVSTHQFEYPDSRAHMDEGLLLLADCMQHPGPETKARAQVFYDTKTFSPMRRRLRRLCLEAS